MGAMENWGLVTYREVRLLVDSEKSSIMAKKDVALVVAHELAHFWFGDLVTMVGDSGDMGRHIHFRSGGPICG